MSAQPILKWGNSLAFRIPSAIAKQMDINEGAEVAFHIDGKRLVIEKADNIPKFTHHDLVKALRKTQKSLVDCGAARGKEIPAGAPAERDIIGIASDSSVRHEHHGRRPVLVVSVNALQPSLGLAMVCAI